MYVIVGGEEGTYVVVRHAFGGEGVFKKDNSWFYSVVYFTTFFHVIITA
jgi:hypothetical protein